MSEDSLATVSPAAPEPLSDLHVYALDAEQMRNAQGSIKAWLERRIAFEKARESDLQHNLDIAIKNAWRYSGIRNQLYHCQRIIRYYAKLHTAVAEGFCIIPNFPIDLFAVRVSSSKRVNGGFEEHAYETTSPGVCDVKEKALPEGEGKYVGPSAMYQHGKTIEKGENGAVKTVHWYQGSSFQDVELPLHVVKPEVMSEVARALSLKVFDAIGVFPQSPRKDPMIIGRILAPKSGHSQASCSFLIAWYLDVHRL